MKPEITKARLVAEISPLLLSLREATKRYLKAPKRRRV